MLQSRSKYTVLVVFLVILIYFTACARVQSPTYTTTPSGTKPVTEKQPVQEPPAVEPQAGISPEVQELLNKYKTKLRSINYKYKGPETADNFHDFYVKGDKIKYLPWLAIKTLDKPESYDSVFVDKTARTIQNYCLAAYCTYKGKKSELSYADAYIKTIFDWLEGITEAEKLGEEVIDDRSTWKIQTNNGILWIDTFYGIPLKVESFGKNYRFQQLSVNGVTDADVTPP